MTSPAEIQQWEFTYVQAPTNNMAAATEAANKLGALGWEPVGVASADKTIGLNSNVLIFKRLIVRPLPPSTSNDEWQDDPSGRFDLRRWDEGRGVWTAEVAVRATKTYAVDPPAV